MKRTSREISEEAVEMAIGDGHSPVPYSLVARCAIVLTVAATMGLVGLAALLYLLYGLYSLVHWHDLNDLAPVLAAFVAMSMFSPTPIMASLLLAVIIGTREASDAKVH